MEQSRLLKGINLARGFELPPFGPTFGRTRSRRCEGAATVGNPYRRAAARSAAIPARNRLSARPAGLVIGVEAVSSGDGHSPQMGEVSATSASVPGAPISRSRVDGSRVMGVRFRYRIRALLL